MKRPWGMAVLRGAAFVCGDDQPIPSGTAIVVVLADADRRAPSP